MKRIIFIFIVCTWISISFSQQPNQEANVDSLCAERGHIILDTDIYTVERENVLPVIVDYQDSTVVYFYKDNIQKGTMSMCSRCGKWISVPQMDEPLIYVAWRKEIQSEKTIKDSLGG